MWHQFSRWATSIKYLDTDDNAPYVFLKRAVVGLRTCEMRGLHFKDFVRLNDRYKVKLTCKSTKTIIQWTPDVKFISATLKEFWSKMIFEQQNQKKFPEFFFSEKYLGKKI